MNTLKYSSLTLIFLMSSLRAHFFDDSFDRMIKFMDATRQYMHDKFKKFEVPPLLEVKLEENMVIVEMPAVTQEGVKVQGSAQEVEVTIEHEGKKVTSIIHMLEHAVKKNQQKIYALVVRAEEKEGDSVRRQEVYYSLKNPLHIETVQSEYEKDKKILRLTFKINVPEKREIPLLVK